MADETTPTTETAEPRRKLGKYELVERFERGGMASVFKAYDVTLDRYVAIKQIAAHLADDPKFVERFRHEAQVLAKLGEEATHIVSIHELVEDEEGGLYIVMEYVEGKPLEAYLETAPISAAAAVKLLGQLARGLRAVHQKGIIHRDVKPLNIIVTPTGRVKITDFGLAAHSGGSTSMSMGTTKYMAPELFQGGVIDGRADLYSLGFIMYELLCPIDRFNEIFEDVLHDERSEALRWMSWHADPERVVPPLVEVNPKVPKRLSSIVERLMAKDPNVRFFSAEEVLRELKQRFGRGSSGTAAVSGDLARKELGLKEGEGGEDGGVGDGAAKRKSGPGDTAPLPQPANWRKRGIIIAAAAAVLIVGLVVARKFMLAEKNRAITLANATDAKAQKAYKAGNYADAAKHFAVVIENAGRYYPNSTMVLEAKKKRALAEAHVLRDQRRWNEADQRLDEADKLGVERRKIDNFRIRMEDLRTFYGLIAKADEAMKKDLYAQALTLLAQATEKGLDAEAVQTQRAEVMYRKAMFEGNRLLTQGDFEAAQARFLEAKRLRATPEVDARLKHIQQNMAFYKAFKAATDAMDRRDYNEAIRQYTQALEHKDDAKAKDGLLEARYLQAIDKAKNLEDRKLWADAVKAYEVANGIKPSPEAMSRIQAIQGRMKLATLLAEANKAERDGDLDTAIRKLTEARAIEPSLERDARIIELRYRRAMTEAQKREREGKWAEAESKYLEALRIKGTPEVERAIRHVQQRRKYAELVTAGDKLVEAQLFQQAEQEFLKAQKVRPGKEIEDRIGNCRYEINYRIGQKQEAAGNLKGARAYYLLAQRQKATPEIQAAIERVTKRLQG